MSAEVSDTAWAAEVRVDAAVLVRMESAVVTDWTTSAWAAEVWVDGAPAARSELVRLEVAVLVTDW